MDKLLSSSMEGLNPYFFCRGGGGCAWGPGGVIPSYGVTGYVLLDGVTFSQLALHFQTFSIELLEWGRTFSGS